MIYEDLIPAAHLLRKLASAVDLSFVPLAKAEGYDTDANHRQLKDNGQRSSIVVKNNRTNPEIIGQPNPKS